MTKGVSQRKLREDQSFCHEIPEGHHDLIGRVVAAWSYLEVTLDDLIWHFLDLSDEDGRLITARLDARPKLEMIRQLGARYLPKSEFEQLCPLLDTIEDLRGDRNAVGHAVWGSIAPEKKPAAALSMRPKAPPGEVALETFPPIRMKSIADGIDHARFQIVDLTAKLEPLRSRSRKPPLR